MRVLLADDDSVRAKALADACALRGYRVDHADHGAAALEIGLERVPDVIICPVELPIIDGVRLAEILRNNPRTCEASFVFLVEDELDAPVLMDLRDRVAMAPWEEGDVLEVVDGLMRRQARYAEMGPDTQVEGKLSQIPLVDLLQMFSSNCKSGTIRISLEGGGEEGAIHLLDGQIVDAWLMTVSEHRIVGEKALFRLMAARDGRFEFAPGEPTPRSQPMRGVRALLLEGMRQLDECAELRHDLPAPDTPLAVKLSREELKKLGHVVVQEVVEAVAEHKRLGAVLDCCALPDSQVMRALYDLIKRGAIAVAQAPEVPESGTAPSGLFTPAQIRRIRAWASSQVPTLGPHLKMLVVPGDESALGDFFETLSESDDFAADPRRAADPTPLLGSLGYVKLGDGLRLQVLAVPTAAAYAPAWPAMAHGMLGALVLVRPPATSTRALASVCEVLNAAAARPVIYVLETGVSAPTLGDAERAELERVGAGELYVLPTDPDPSRGSVLQSLLSRLVP